MVHLRSIRPSPVLALSVLALALVVSQACRVDEPPAPASGDAGGDAGPGNDAARGPDTGLGGNAGSGADAALGADALADGGLLTLAPTVTSTDPASNGVDVAINVKIAALFSTAMDPSTLTAVSFTLRRGTAVVTGTVTYAGSTATLTPASNLEAGASYIATVSTGAKDLAGRPLASPHSWSFVTGATAAMGPAPVRLGTAGEYAVLAKTAISTVPDSRLTGDLGLSPAAATFVTGFSLIADASNVFSTSTQVVGKVYAANHAVPSPSRLTTAISDMESAYTDAAGRPTPDFLELGTGEIGGKTLAPGLYKWTSAITISSDVTIAGGANDVWIFQASGDVTLAAAKNVTLGGGARAKNVFWQIAGAATFGANSHFEGIVLGKTGITLQTGATMNGRALAQTMVALQKATITQPAP